MFVWGWCVIYCVLVYCFFLFGLVWGGLIVCDLRCVIVLFAFIYSFIWLLFGGLL